MILQIHIYYSRLGGRLDLLVSQIKLNTEDDTLASENLLVYEDRGMPFNANTYSIRFLNNLSYFLDSSDDEGLVNTADESSDDWEEEESELENGDENMEVSGEED